MPGILPMKVIKVGPGAQSRIAQACDRCRSKKIRCDGITPCCSQCATVGFECKTSDKLSRRAFPRGYTESLEERVRALETEVKELKDLLDEKDEKIDILSKIHSNSPHRRPSVPISPASSSSESVSAPLHVKEETFRVQQSPVLLNAGKSDPFFMGASTGKTFIDAFKSKLQQSGKSCPPFSTSSFFATDVDQMPKSKSDEETAYRGPPSRLVSDQLVNRFFQEWAPLFPVLHRPTFLKLYAEYTTDPDKVKSQAEIAQLNLVFAIAVLSADCNRDTLPSFDFQWQGALESIISENTLATLQCLVLAQIYCICSANYKALGRYTGVAVALAYRLGLHQSQKRFSLGVLTRETRKKVFWTLYTVDCFSAATLGLPKLFKDEGVHTEYPSDIDDENVTERGFQPALPGESTRLSSALALFRLARVMSKVLGELYPAAPSYEISLSKIATLNEELDAWHDGLASHLRLQFIQDKPSTNVISSRSPLISLAFYYTRTLIHRPVVTSELGPKASSTVALSEASKRIIQIVQLLEERRMSFSICVNRNELLLLAGFALLQQGLDLKEDSKLLADNQRLACSIIDILTRQAYLGTLAFKEVACAVIAVDVFTKPASPIEHKPVVRRDSTASMPAPQSASTSLSVRKQLQAISSRFSFGANRPSPRNAKYEKGLGTHSSLAVGNLALYARNASRASLSSVQSEPPLSKRTHSGSQPTIGTPTIVATGNVGPNLDYLSFNNGDGLPPSPTFLPSPANALSSHPLEWERMLCYVEANQYLPLGYEHGLPPQAYPPAYHPPPNLANISPEMLSGNVSYVDTASPTLDWTSEVCWSGTSESCGQESSSGGNAHSVFSLSEESLTSGEESGGGCDLGADLGQEYLGVDWVGLGGLEEGVRAEFG